MKRRVNRKPKSKSNYGWAILVLIAIYFMYVAVGVFVGAISNEEQATEVCSTLCQEKYGASTWQTASNSDACKNGVYFCECSENFGEEPSEKNFKIDVNTGKVLSTETAYGILNARKDSSCW